MCGRHVLRGRHTCWANEIPRVSLEASGPGGIGSRRDEDAKREQGGGVQNIICMPGVQLGAVMFDGVIVI